MENIIKIEKFIQIDSVPVTNNRAVLDWYIKSMSESFKKGKKSLSADLRDELTNIFGKQNKTVTFEFRHKLWYLSYKGDSFYVYSASGKGTNIEICGYTYEEIRLGKKQNEIIEFLTELVKLIHHE